MGNEVAISKGHLELQLYVLYLDDICGYRMGNSDSAISARLFGRKKVKSIFFILFFIVIISSLLHLVYWTIIYVAVSSQKTCKIAPEWRRQNVLHWCKYILFSFLGYNGLFYYVSLRKCVIKKPSQSELFLFDLPGLVKIHFSDTFL